jgi:hypothetical protein
MPEHHQSHVDLKVVHRDRVQNHAPSAVTIHVEQTLLAARPDDRGAVP